MHRPAPFCREAPGGPRRAQEAAEYSLGPFLRCRKGGGMLFCRSPGLGPAWRGGGSQLERGVLGRRGN